MDTKQIRNTLLLALTALVWGSAFVAQSVGAEHVGPFTFLSSRSYLGGIVLLPVIAAMNTRSKRSSGVSLLPKTPGDKKQLLLGGISCGFFLFWLPRRSKSAWGLLLRQKPVSSPQCMY